MASNVLTFIGVAGRFASWSRALRWLLEDVYHGWLQLSQLMLNRTSWPLSRTEEADRRLNRLELDFTVYDTGELVGRLRSLDDLGELVGVVGLRSLGPKLSGDRRGEEERNESD